MSDKNFKIWGVSYGLVGDLIMGLPVLRYFEKKYPGSYKIWAIEKKVGFMAPFFLNHPLIDNIRITQEWNSFGVEDYAIANTCDVKCTMDNWYHNPIDWYNYRNCVEETARVAGIYDLKEVLTEDEMIPELYRWFDVGPDDPNFQTYSKQNTKTELNDNTIAIFPFATATSSIARSPSIRWWLDLIYGLTRMGYKVYQFGYPSDTMMADWYNGKSFFDQVKIALSTKMSIGTDSGNMWVMGAYNHPAIHLMTNWMQHHHQNFDALLPVNRNGHKIFAEGGTNNIQIEDVLNKVEYIMGGVECNS
jgi:ADP-heptose:LPS heptosyltransferase